MIRSMTGYGRREAAPEGWAVAVEARAVNHRFCETVIRLPKTLASLEDELKRAVQERCQRGRIELTVALIGEEESKKTLSLDRPLARQYYRLLRDLQRELHLGGTVDLAVLAGFRDIVSISERTVGDQRLKWTVRRLARGALSDLDSMRRREGRILTRDVKSRLRLIRAVVTAIGKRAPLVVQGYFERMKARVEKLVGPGQTDASRLNQELAQYADRCDLTEELTRLGSHLVQFDGVLRSREAAGRTLDFLLQEMGREVNTIGAKANDAEISTHVVRVKGELEKIREQVQNIE
jgi:uncharacterized protein (TIGR00255 family)